jgi:PAS domain S-box-containing protein
VSEAALNVLVIENDAADRRAMRGALEAAGFAVQEAADAGQGLRLARSSAPDCILFDDALPDAAGLDIMESLRRPDGTLPCAAVMLTAAENANVATAAIKAGAYDYLVRDRLDADILGQAIGSAVQRFRVLEAQRWVDRYNAHLAAVVAASDDAIISTRTDFGVQTWNPGAQRMFGYDEAEARGRTLPELIVPNGSEAESAAIYAAVMHDGRTVRKEVMRRHKDGHMVPVEIITSPILDSSGRITGSTNIYRDISERLRAEESETRFRVTFESAPLGIAHVAADGRWLRVNRALCHILGYSAEELTSSTFQDVTHPDDVASSVARLNLACENMADRYDADKRYIRKDGTVVWARLTVSIVRKRDGTIDYLVTVVEDISARKRAEQELRKSEERFRSSLLRSPVPIMLFDDRENIVAVSQSWLDKTGYTRDELRRLGDWTVRACGNGDALAVNAYLREIISREPEAEAVDHPVRTRDGRERLWSFLASSLGPQSDGRRLFISVAQDLTEQKAHEEQIHLLMREANHRAKNMLGLVQAIARQAVSHSPEHFIERFTESIQALAANQDLLVRNEWKGVDAEDLVHAQLAHFADPAGTRIVAHGPRLRLNAAAAQAIGLALHELATNSGKYGALSADTGRVDIRWEAGGGDFTMSWTERQGPPVSPPEHRGFGTVVIKALAERSVGGAVDLDYAVTGVTWRLTCPAVKALEGTANGHGRS